MEDYNSNSTGSESDQEESGLRSNRASTFVMNEGFEFDLGGGDDGKPLQSWSFKKIRDDFKSQRPANTTSVNEKISKLLSRRETREKNLQKMQQSQQQQQKRKSEKSSDGPVMSFDDDEDEDALAAKIASLSKAKSSVESDADSNEDVDANSESDDGNDADGDEDEDEMPDADDDEGDEQEAEDDDDDDDVDEDDVEDMAGASASSAAHRAVSASAGAAAKAAAAFSLGGSGGVVRDLSKVPTRVSGRPARVQFAQLNLSKPLLRAVADLGFATATPVQAATIPVALTGSDVLANAVTGSGKTAAFMLPILERLLYRPRRVPTSRVVVLTPTRELAAQCHSMTENLARYTDIRVCLIVGGLSAQVQEAALRQSPDIVVATPGRLIDHLRNSQSVHLEDVEILVLDEADRLLEMGFIDEVREVVRACPKGRQTMLFSATLTDQVNDLARLSLHNPQKIAVDPMYSLADHLVQEFIRIRPSRESDREAIVVALCARSFTSRVIVFFRNKAHCHRMAILFGLNQLNAAELHGNLTQTQRLEALDKFREGEANFLLCTDLASRGLDIKGVETVINYHFPSQLASYIHRVGRTARAGQTGRSVTLVGEQQRKLLKEVVRRAPAGVKSRSLPDAVIAHYKNLIETQESDVTEIIKQERMEKEMRVAEMQVNKANNIMEHEREIMSRPKKTWFQSEKERQAAKLAGRDEDEDEDSDDEEDKMGKKGGKGKEDKEEKDKSKEKDPYAGLSRKQKRRKMQLEQETKELARAHAEERAEAEAAGSGSDDEADSKGKGKPKPKAPAAAGKVRVTKADLEVAAKRLANLQSQQKALAKSVKKESTRRQLSMDEEVEAAATAATAASSANKKKRRVSDDGDDDGGDSDGDAGTGGAYLGMDELARPAGRAAKKKAKRAVAEAGVLRFASKKRDPDSFAARYKQSGPKADGSGQAADGPNKPHRVKSKKAFKSKARHKRR